MIRTENGHAVTNLIFYCVMIAPARSPILRIANQLDRATDLYNTLDAQCQWESPQSRVPN